MPTSLVQAVTDANFAELVEKSKLLALVDFWNPRFPVYTFNDPSVLEEVAHIYEGQITVLRMDVNANRDTRKKKNISGMPFLALFKNGNMVDPQITKLDLTGMSKYIQALLP
jgi:thioredoxin 1